MRLTSFILLLLLTAMQPAYGLSGGYYLQDPESDPDPDPDRSVAVMTVRAEVIQGQTASLSYPAPAGSQTGLIYDHVHEPGSPNDEKAVLTLTYAKESDIIVDIAHTGTQLLKESHHLIYGDDNLPSAISPTGEVHIELTWKKGESVKSQVIIEYI
jgi:hypothetical protein